MLRRQENLNFVMDEIDDALAGRPDGDDLVDEMLSLGSVVRLADGTVADPANAAPTCVTGVRAGRPGPSVPRAAGHTG